MGRVARAMPTCNTTRSAACRECPSERAYQISASYCSQIQRSLSQTYSNYDEQRSEDFAPPLRTVLPPSAYNGLILLICYILLQTFLEPYSETLDPNGRRIDAMKPEGR